MELLFLTRPKTKQKEKTRGIQSDLKIVRNSTAIHLTAAYLVSLSIEMVGWQDKGHTSGCCAHDRHTGG